MQGQASSSNQGLRFIVRDTYVQKGIVISYLEQVTDGMRQQSYW